MKKEKFKEFYAWMKLNNFLIVRCNDLNPDTVEEITREAKVLEEYFFSVIYSKIKEDD